MKYTLIFNSDSIFYHMFKLTTLGATDDYLINSDDKIISFESKEDFNAVLEVLKTDYPNSTLTPKNPNTLLVEG